MTNENMMETLQELRKPFHPSQVTWRPGAVSADQSKALGLAYADLRAYQNRLDEIFGMDWSVSYTPWGERIICHLTIHGITRSSTGEPDSQSERSEIAGTATEAQAFKRACAMFGLGRYLYNFPSVWVEYNRESRYFTDRGKARLEMIVANQYRRTTEPEATPEESVAPQENGAQDSSEERPENGVEHRSDPVAATEDEGLAKLRNEFDHLGEQLYGEQWSQVSQHNIARISQGQANNSAQLSAEQIQRLIDGLKSLQRSRQRVKSSRAVTAAAMGR